jgi:hypothetical protein
MISMNSVSPDDEPGASTASGGVSAGRELVECSAIVPEGSFESIDK